ncbi:MAG: peptide chain release factor 2 [Massilimaliae sp.]|nr:peptide chain release factor 2 [Massiliimalia sp.]
MLQFEEYKFALGSLKPQLDDLGEALGLERARNEVKELEAQAAEAGFWDDAKNSQKVLRKTSELKSMIEKYEKLYGLYEDIATLVEMGMEEEDESLLPEIKEQYDRLEQELEAQKLATILSGEYDANNAILTFHAGAGGTEAQDWVEMLYRMYTRWSERHGFRYKILDYLDGDEAGIKSASILIEGLNAYGFLKSEAGVHRLVRVSPFDASGRRHTSFASLEVMPEIDDTIEIEISPDDLRVDTYRSGGAGGQHINKTDSAVRITHLPTGIVVSCQNERSQHQNRDVAMKMLKSKLIEIKEREHLEKIEDIKGEHKEIAWGSQIRSYVFMPYTLVKDHRTGFENGNVSAVMDGDLDGFINAYLKAKSLGDI